MKKNFRQFLNNQKLRMADCPPPFLLHWRDATGNNFFASDDVYARVCEYTVATVESTSRCASGIPVAGDEIGFLTSVGQAGLATAAASSQANAPAASASGRRCRWNVTVAPGRTINVTLYDFGLAATRRRHHTSHDQQRRSRYTRY